MIRSIVAYLICFGVFWYYLLAPANQEALTPDVSIENAVPVSLAFRGYVPETPALQKIFTLDFERPDFSNFQTTVVIEVNLKADLTQPFSLSGEAWLTGTSCIYRSEGGEVPFFSRGAVKLIRTAGCDTVSDYNLTSKLWRFAFKTPVGVGGLNVNGVLLPTGLQDDQIPEVFQYRVLAPLKRHFALSGVAMLDNRDQGARRVDLMARSWGVSREIYLFLLGVGALSLLSGLWLTWRYTLGKQPHGVGNTAWRLLGFALIALGFCLKFTVIVPPFLLAQETTEVTEFLKAHHTQDGQQIESWRMSFAKLYASSRVFALKNHDQFKLSVHTVGDERQIPQRERFAIDSKYDGSALIGSDSTLKHYPMQTPIDRSDHVQKFVKTFASASLLGVDSLAASFFLIERLLHGIVGILALMFIGMLLNLVVFGPSVASFVLFASIVFPGILIAFVGAGQSHALIVSGILSAGILLSSHALMASVSYKIKLWIGMFLIVNAGVLSRLYPEASMSLWYGLFGIVLFIALLPRIMNRLLPGAPIYGDLLLCLFCLLLTLSHPSLPGVDFAAVTWDKLTIREFSSLVGIFLRDFLLGRDTSAVNIFLNGGIELRALRDFFFLHEWLRWVILIFIMIGSLLRIVKALAFQDRNDDWIVVMGSLFLAAYIVFLGYTNYFADERSRSLALFAYVAMFFLSCFYFARSLSWTVTKQYLVTLIIAVTLLLNSAGVTILLMSIVQ